MGQMIETRVLVPDISQCYAISPGRCYGRACRSVSENPYSLDIYEEWMQIPNRSYNAMI